MSVYLTFTEYTIYIMETFNKIGRLNTLGILDFTDPLNSDLSEFYLIFSFLKTHIYCKE